MKRQEFEMKNETPVKKWQHMSPLDDDLAIIESQQSQDDNFELFNQLVWHTPAISSPDEQSSLNQQLSEEDLSSDHLSQKILTQNPSCNTVNVMKHQPNNAPKRIALTPIDTNRKGCNCRNSKCQKHYCECLRAGKVCMEGICNCCDCHNLEHKQIHDHISKKLLNQQALPAKGCRCKKSKCLKKYCQCHSNGNRCVPQCECVDCQNLDLEDKQNNHMLMLIRNSSNIIRKNQLNV